MIDTFITRKCGCCGEEFQINKNNVSNAIYYDSKTYHSKCFTDLCEKRSKNKRVDISKRWTQVLNNIDSIKDNSYTHLMSSIIKEDIFIFIKDAYDITIVPSIIWQKISDINTGTYKYMGGNGIPLEHLIDMWKRKMNMLNNIANDNKTKGKIMNTQQRISYDLSVLVNKYDSYLKWLEKKRINDIENEQIKSDKLVAETINIVSAPKKFDYTTKPNSDDISDLVDDIFG